MKPNIQSILEDCIERGITSTLNNKDADWSDDRLLQALLQRIWFEIDLYFDFDETP